MSRFTVFETPADKVVKITILFWLGVELVLVLLDLTLNYGQLIPLGNGRRVFNMAREDAIATWVSGLQLVLVAGVTALIHARLKQREEDAGRWPLAWAILACFFLYMAVDDSAKIHERAGSALRAIFGELGVLEMFPSYTWQLIYAPIFGAAALLISATVLWQLKEMKWRVLVAGGLGCYVAAVGMDFLEGIDGLYESWARSLHVREYTVSHLCKITEELIELAGTTLMMGGYLGHFTGLADGVKWTFSGRSD